MVYSLKNCRNGENAVYATTLEIKEENGRVFFKFVAENSKYYCPHGDYNKIHAEGDACEIFIGSDLERRWYYEIEISPQNKLMLAKIEYTGVNQQGNPVLNIHFVEDCFLKSSVTKTENGYIAEISFDKASVITGDGEIYFNAYRIETDGGEMEKHLFALFPTMQGKFHVPLVYRHLKDYVK